MNKLKPCPFCGGSAVGWCDANDDDTCQRLYIVECIDCGANIGWYPSAIKAGKAWNRRGENGTDK